MREEIYQKLNVIEDLNDRAVLKKVLNNLFVTLEEYTEKRIDNLEERVFKELQYSQEKYNVFSTVVKREEVDPTNEFLFPIYEGDLEEKIYDSKEIIKNIAGKKASKIFNVFFKCDYSTFKTIVDGKKVFKGRIETNIKTYNCDFTLGRNAKYHEKIVDLYKSFLDNNVPWVTLNTAYISRFADVFLTGCESEIGPGEVINTVAVDYGEYSNYIEHDMVPLWNIKKVTLKSNGFPMPCLDSINFEHVLSIKKDGLQHGYLVQYDPTNIEYIFRNEDSLTISSPVEEAKDYDSWKVISPSEAKNERYQYEIVSNARMSTFTGRLIAKNGLSIRTKGELARIINSFQVSKYLEFQYVKLENKSKKSRIETYDMNYFIEDEIREDYAKKVLALYFKAVDSSYYLTSDILSFIVSEIQLLYPEYKCEGRLI